MRGHPGEVLLGYALELVVSALRGARMALGCIVGHGDDGSLRPPATHAGAGHDGRDERHAASARRPPDDPESLRRALATTPPLPTSYGDDRLVLLARDPGTLFAYWDLAPGFDHPPGMGDTSLVLRIEDLTLLDFAAAQPRQQHDFEIEGLVGSRYVDIARSAGTYRALLGWRGADGSFVRRVQSATVTTPRADAPGTEPVRWMTVQTETGRAHTAGDAPARLVAEAAAAPRGAPAVTPSVAPRSPASSDVHARAPSADSRAPDRRGR